MNRKDAYTSESRTNVFPSIQKDSPYAYNSRAVTFLVVILRTQMPVIPNPSQWLHPYVLDSKTAKAIQMGEVPVTMLSSLTMFVRGDSSSYYDIRRLVR